MEDVLSWAETRFDRVKQAGPNEIHVACPFCGEDSGKRGRLYINVDPSMDPPGLFHCKLCDERGAWNKLRKFFGDPIITDGEGRSYDNVTPRVLAAANAIFVENISQRARKYLNDRGFSDETIEKHSLGWADGTLLKRLSSEFTPEELLRSGLIVKRKDDTLRDFLYSHITIPYFVSGNVVSIRGKEIGGKYLTPPGHKAFLYNSDVVWGDKLNELVICEGEFDALTVEQLGYNAVGVPGANTWQENWNGYVDAEMVSRLYICFDADKAGKAGAEKLSDILGGRAKIIELPSDSFGEEGGNDISDWVRAGHTKEDFDALLSVSKGGMLVSVREAYERWLEIEGNPNLVGLKFGISKIDEAIKPGILPGQVVVTLAKTGAGKTISMLNFMHRMKNEQDDRHFLFISLEQTRNEWFERARRIHKFYNPSAKLSDTIGFWESNFMMVDKNRVGEDELFSCVEQYEYEVGVKPDLICIDYLGYWARSFSGPAYERTSAAIMSCKAMSKSLQIPIYAPHQVSRMADAGEEPEMDAARDSGVIEETADFVFALWAADQKKGVEQNQRTGRVSMKMLKSRHGGVGTKVDFLFTPKTLVMVPENDMFHYKAADEIRLVRVGDDLDTVIYRNLTGWDGTIVTSEIRADIERLKHEGFM